MIQLCGKSIVKILKYLLESSFSYLNEHKFRPNFLDPLNPMCSCGSEPETTATFPCVAKIM